MSRASSGGDRNSDALAASVRRAARALNSTDDLTPLLDAVGDARFVLLGEASHGTSEFYAWRAELSKRLIVEKGFSFVGVGGDWPDCYRVNRYVKGLRDSGASAEEVLHAFARWPTWMWANREVAAFTEWLREHNDALTPDRQVGFFGLDVYSLWESMSAVVEYLERIDPVAARAARRANGCFDPYHDDAQDYARATALVPTSCEDEVVSMLGALRAKALAYREDGRDAYFDAQQNALVARNAELYYRTMIRGGPTSWNVRDHHMVDTLDRLMTHHGSGAKSDRVGAGAAIMRVRIALTIATCSLLIGCGETARLPISAGIGPQPTLTAPNKTLIPTVKVAEAKGWAIGEQRVPAAGTRVNPFATGLEHPRFLFVLPNGDVLVAETNAPPKPDDNNGIKGWFFKRFQKKAGGAVPSANRITLLRDKDGDGVAETRSVLLAALTSPFGITLIGQELFVANSDALVRFPYSEGATQITSPGTTVVALPGGRLNHHWTKTIVASADRSKLFVSVGSNSNVAEHGMEVEEGRAAIWEVDPKTGTHRIYASGLRNAVGLAIEPQTGVLWASVNERDELGSDLVPDYLTSVRDSGFYGWPYSYFGQHVDDRVKPQRPDLVAKAIVPEYGLGSHTGSLGLASSQGATLGAQFSNGMFVGQHGSWNRNPRSGYKVIFVPFAQGKPAGVPIDVLSDFLNEKGHARGDQSGSRWTNAAHYSWWTTSATPCGA